MSRANLGTSSTGMRNSNELLILNMIRRQSLSRAQIARLSGLSRAGVTVIVDNLIQRGYICETSAQGNGVGRKSVGLHICADAGFIIGIHLHSASCEIGVFDFLGKMLYQRDITYDTKLVAIAQLVSVGKALIDMLNEYGIPQDKVLGVGICTGGPVDVIGGKVVRPSSKWHEIEIVKLFESITPWRCSLTNRSTARTMYEKYYGVCRKYSDFIYLKVDEAAGGGVVVNDKMLSGYNQFGNEFGHMTIRYDGEQCECGNVGCLNMYASIPAILKQFEALGFSDWKDVMDTAYKGDPGALQMVRVEADYLSACITSMCNLLEPQAVVLAGDIIYRHGLLEALIRENVNTRRILRNCHDLEILVADDVDHAYIRAAAAIVIERLFEGELVL